MIILKALAQLSRTSGLVFALLSAVAGSTTASAQTLTTLANFSGGPNYGAAPRGSLIADANGDLFGTTLIGGLSGLGTVFEIVNTTSGYAGTPITLVSFNGTDGAHPQGGLIADSDGNLFGTTWEGGSGSWGTVYEIAKTSSGYASTPTTLVSFNEDDGAFPQNGLIADANGNLLGTTQYGGPYNAGTVFEIAKTSNGYASTPTTLVGFNVSNGASPQCNLIADTNGNLFGTTLDGGAYGAGTVFEIFNTVDGYSSTPITLVSFNATDGANPQSGLIADTNGSLFGATISGGAYGVGTVFEITKTSSGYATAPTTLVSFDNPVGSGSHFYSVASLISDANGDLFGTSPVTGSNYGTVFEIVNSRGAYADTPTILTSFDLSNGAFPATSLLADANGNLYGTTVNGGQFDDGTVFEISESGFVLPNEFAGTPGSANCNGKSLSTLAQTYGGIAQAAPALGFASTSALQGAVATYCGK